ncbi:hypothetical protein MTQ19_10165, partial [Corynebacterium bovis]
MAVTAVPLAGASAPAVADGSSEDGIRTTAFRGTGVVDTDGDLVVPAEDRRALTDADMDWRETLGDALGPVLGGYLLDGVAEGR